MAAKSMNKSSYDVRLAAGTITAGGTLGILIPPSIMLVVMGPIMEIPVLIYLQLQLFQEFCSHLYMLHTLQ